MKMLPILLQSTILTPYNNIQKTNSVKITIRMRRTMFDDHPYLQKKISYFLSRNQCYNDREYKSTTKLETKNITMITRIVSSILEFKFKKLRG